MRLPCGRRLPVLDRTFVAGPAWVGTVLLSGFGKPIFQTFLVHLSLTRRPARGELAPDLLPKTTDGGKEVVVNVTAGVAVAKRGTTEVNSAHGDRSAYGVSWLLVCVVLVGQLLWFPWFLK